MFIQNAASYCQLILFILSLLIYLLNIPQHSIIICHFTHLSGKRIRRGDTFPERTAENVSSQAGGIRAETFLAGAADEQDPAAVSEPSGGQ